MTPKDFIDGICAEINVALEFYKENYLKTELNEIPDSLHRKTFSFFRSLKAEEQELFFRIIKNIQIDNTATLFALIDGVFYLKNQKADFKLIYQDNLGERIISGDLKDLFLERVEIEELEENS